MRVYVYSCITVLLHRGVNYTENICKLALTMWNSMQDDARGPWRQQRSTITGGILQQAVRSCSYHMLCSRALPHP
jgi:hypothetical protein